MPKIWTVSQGGLGPVTTLAALRKELLAQRGVTDDRAEDFFSPQYESAIHNPDELSDMGKAVDRIYHAVEASEHILIYGDYDADGICSAAIMVTVLRDLGAKAVPYLPHRIDDGYGLNQAVLQQLVSEFDLLISVDCGISNGLEIAWLNSQGKDTIVVDHHSLPDVLPPAVAILHPGHRGANYPFAGLSGTGVSWKLACALLRDKRSPYAHDREREIQLLDLACLGTVADMVPLLGENRAIVKFGLPLFKRNDRVGMKVMCQALGKNEDVIDEETVGYRIAPLLNAAGRLDHAQPALDLLLAPDENKAQELLAKLRQYNQRRQVHSRRMQREAEQQIAAFDAPLLFAADNGWEPGVVGLVAGQLSRKFARPSFVIAGGQQINGQPGGHAIGSARAPQGINLLDILQGVSQHLIKFGGHAGAAGFSVAADQVDVLRDSLLQWVPEAGASDAIHGESADVVVSHDLLDWNTLDLVDQFAPFGEGNRRPAFVAQRLPLVSWRKVGKSQDHAKFVFRCGDDVLNGIGFGLSSSPSLQKIGSGELVDVLFSLEMNEYLGRRSLQLKVTDIAAAGAVEIREDDRQ